MNGTEPRSDEIERYLGGVRSALADLPDDVRDELLEDLPAHLTEVAREDPATLEDRLGSPASYAAELRAAAGLRPGPARWGVPPGLVASGVRLRDWAGRNDRRVGRAIGYGRLTEFLSLLIPAWWLVRGYVADVVLFGLPHRMSGVVPAVGGNILLGWVLMLACVVGSIWLGHWARGGRPGWQRLGLLGANLLLGVLALVVVAQFDDNTMVARQAATNGPEAYDPYGYITDLIPVGPDGKALTGVTLLDQNGNQVNFGNPNACPAPTATPPSGASSSPGPGPNSSPGPSTSPAPTPSPTPSPGVSASVAPSH